MTPVLKIEKKQKTLTSGSLNPGETGFKELQEVVPLRHLDEPKLLVAVIQHKTPTQLDTAGEYSKKTTTKTKLNYVTFVCKCRKLEVSPSAVVLLIISTD